MYAENKTTNIRFVEKIMLKKNVWNFYANIFEKVLEMIREYFWWIYRRFYFLHDEKNKW